MTIERKQLVMSLAKYFENISKEVNDRNQFSEYREMLRKMKRDGFISMGERRYIVGRMLKVSKIIDCIGGFYLVRKKYK